MKHIKTLGLLAVAVMAMMAVFGIASASAAKFTAGKVGAKLTHTTLEANVFTITGSRVECSETFFAGATEGLESEEQVVAPGYGGCTAFGFPSTVNTEGCVYRFTANGDVHLEKCKKGGITVSFSNFFAKCHLIVKNQTISKAVSYQNTEGDLDLTINATGIHAEVTESVGLCPLAVGTHTNATTTMKATVQAEGTTISWDK